jgi:uncharacterized coiled-coil DUF342 family protein
MEQGLLRAAASARAEVREELLDAQAHAGRLSDEGQALEAERYALVDQLAELQAERDQAVTSPPRQATEIDSPHRGTGAKPAGGRDGEVGVGERPAKGGGGD